MKRIIYTNDEGGVSIIVPASECGLTIEQIAEKDVPAGKAYKIVDVSEIPSDRTYRNAWVDNDGVKVDMPKAVEIQKEKLRAERAPLLEALDQEFMKALEKGADTTAIVAEKERLRDITKLKALSDATTPEELKAVSCSTVEIKGVSEEVIK